MTQLPGYKILKSICFILPAAFFAGCGEAQVAPERPQPLVRTAVVSEVSYAPTTCLTGEVRARVQTNLSFRVSGRITERTVEVGDHVTPDQVLARIDPTEQRADVVSAEASVQSSEAGVRQTRAAFERQKALIKDGFTTKRDYDQAEQALRTAEGSLEAAKAQLGTVRDALSYTELRSGAAGVITARNAEAGQVAQAAQTMFSLAEDGARDAVFHVYEAAFLQKMASNTVTLSLVSNPQISANGVVREVSPSADTSSGTVRVKVSINDPPPKFALGSVVSGCAKLAPRQAVLLPASSLTNDSGAPAVWIVDPETRAVSLKPVSVASYETENVVIDGGLEPGQRVVTGGAKMLRPNQIVALAPEKSS
jgi:RND family efflux transporter MFP subunit